MDKIMDRLTEWIREMLVGAIMDNLSGLFDTVNERVGSIAAEVGTTPENFSSTVFTLIRNLSESVIVPIAGLILTFICTWELIQLIIDHNNLANFDTWIFVKWIFKTFVAVVLVTNCFNIVMAVFDVANSVISSSGSLISDSTEVSADMLDTLETTLEAMDVGPLLGLLIQSFVIRLTLTALNVVIFVIVYGRMIEIYLMTSLAPIPLATFGNREQSQIGQNYLRSIFALAFQGFLIMVCVGIYAALIQTVSVSDSIISSLWGIVGYTVLLAFALFKTSSLSKAIFNAR